MCSYPAIFLFLDVAMSTLDCAGNKDIIYLFIYFFFVNVDVPLIEQPNTKYLGIMIDKHLRWDQQAIYLSKKIWCLIHKVYMLVAILDRKTLIMLYKSLVKTLMILVWGGAHNCHLEQLKTIQNYIVKIILKKPRWLYHTDLLY